MNKMNNTIKRCIISAVSVLLLAAISGGISFAQVPKLLNYQGYLEDKATGLPVEGTKQITFTIYSDAKSTDQIHKLWSETQTVEIVKGRFSVLLGKTTSITLTEAKPYWLGITIGSDPEMTPREELTSALYALFVDGVNLKDGNLGIGTTTPQNKLQIAGGDLAIGDQQHRAGKLRLWQEPDNADDKVSHAIGTEPYHNIYGAGASYEDSIGHKFYRGGDELIAQIGFGGQGTPGRRLDSYFAGKVGIGTTNPAATLEVRDTLRISESSSSDYLLLRTTGTALDIEAFNSPLYINKGSGQETYIMGGNVGIGTTNPDPDMKLHVTGNAKFDFGGGSLLLATPGGWPGMIALSKNGHRRDIIFGDYGIGLWTSSSSAGPQHGENGITIRENGNVGIGTDSPSKTLTVRGNVLIQRKSDGTNLIELGEGLDYAEGFDVTGSTTLEPGTVLIIDPHNPGQLTVSSNPYDTKVAGIVAGAQGMGSGVRLGADQFDYDVALAGRVYCNVDASYGDVSPGDLLTTSPTPGYAMVVKDYARAQGAILGKAMQKLSREQKGQILVLVTLQ